MAEEVILGAIAGTKIAVFTLFLLFLYMTQHASENLDLRLGYIIGGALIIIAIGEFNYALAINEPQQAIIPWLNDLSNLQTFSEAFYLIAGIASVYFFRTFREDIESGA